MGEVAVINNGRAKDFDCISASAAFEVIGTGEIVADEFKGVSATATGNAVVTATCVGGEVFGESGRVDGVSANA